jgi:hypothetical protein
LKLAFEVQPIYFLYRHGIELVLKAFLKSRGVDDKKLKSFGHRLVVLYEACLAQHEACSGASATRLRPFVDSQAAPLVRQVIRLLDAYQQLRYVKIGVHPLPIPEAAEAAADILFSAVAPFCKSDTVDRAIAGYSKQSKPENHNNAKDDGYFT